MVFKKRNDDFKEKDKYTSQLPNLSEYSQNYQKHSQESYLQRSKYTVPKEISTSFFDTNKKLNFAPKFRSSTGQLREPQARDVLDTVYSNMLAKSNKAPRTFYYLGKVPTNGALDVYSMKDFETLTPVYEPTLISKNNDTFQPANKNADLTSLNQ